MICAVPFRASAFAEEINVSADPEGAVSGTRWHAETARIGAESAATSKSVRRTRAMIKTANILVS